MLKKLFSKLIKKENSENNDVPIVANRNNPTSSIRKQQLTSVEPTPSVKEPVLSNEESTPKIVPPQLDVYTFNVAGVTKNNEDNKDIQKLLKQKGKLYLKENGFELYGGFSNKEILEDDLEVSELEDIFFTKQEVSFVPEPTNKYDPNAIKIYINFIEAPIHIGYVPKKENIKVKSILENEDIRRIEVRFVGGKIKSVDYDYENDKDVIVIDELTLGIEVEIYFIKKEKKDNDVLLETENSEEQTDISGQGIILSAELDEDEQLKISVTSLPVGVSTGSKIRDFYVYEWFIKETGEIFYIGKGRGDRYKQFHERAYDAEKIRKMYDTDSRFVATGLTEEEAITLESKEMLRVLNETNDRLTNRMIPLTSKRDNGYNRSPNTPELKFETAPYFYPREIDEHYYGIKPRPFDVVEEANLKSVVFILRNLRDEEINSIYGGDLEKYQEVTNALLAQNGYKILKSKYAKSVTAWIYIGDDSVVNYEVDQKKALERLGRNIPTYHLIDVWKYLKEKNGENTEIILKEEAIINPINSRVPLKDIKNLYDWSSGFAEGMPYWEEGERERKSGNLPRAIELFDTARFHGYNAPALYKSYAMAYRKLKDYDNEVAILDECIERLQSERSLNDTRVVEFKERRRKALLLKQK